PVCGSLNCIKLKANRKRLQSFRRSRCKKVPLQTGRDESHFATLRKAKNRAAWIAFTEELRSILRCDVNRLKRSETGLHQYFGLSLTFSPSLARRAARTTLALSLANKTAAARPIPELAPVTIAGLAQGPPN